MSVTVTISTKSRYFKTLPLAIKSIIDQTVPPDKLIIFDDNDNPQDLRGISPYNHLFSLLSSKGIQWKVLFGGKKGQVYNHQMALNIADTDYILRLDDDESMAPNCLENLLSAIIKDPAIGAVGGLVLTPNNECQRPSFASNKIEDIYSGFNIQWYRWGGEHVEVDHLYSTFLYKVEAGRKAGGYCNELSPVGHREETMFSYQIKRAGYKLFVTPYSLTWHLREDEGGIRTFKDPSLWQHDEIIFKRKLFEWGITPVEYKFVVLDCGVGDHICFASILPEFIKKHAGKKIIIACCYNEVFNGIEGITLASIADAKAAFNNIDNYNIYKFCADRNWNKPLAEAFRAMYL
jgi:GT2 family glycosyltransferase